MLSLKVSQAPFVTSFPFSGMILEKYGNGIWCGKADAWTSKVLGAHWRLLLRLHFQHRLLSECANQGFAFAFALK